MPDQIIRPSTKVCKDCHCELNKEEHFYKGGSKSYQSRCKGCFNSYTAINIKERRSKQVKKVRCGFFKLTEDTQNTIKAEIAQGKKIKAVARHHNIPYSSLYLWYNKGYTRLEPQSEPTSKELSL